jgi:hypothetical protein
VIPIPLVCFALAFRTDLNHCRRVHGRAALRWDKSPYLIRPTRVKRFWKWGRSRIAEKRGSSFNHTSQWERS